MLKINSLNESSFSLENNQDPYEIIYADRRNEEVHSQILKKAQLNAHMARWSIDLEYNHSVWSDGVYEILEIDSKKYGASYNSFMKVIHSEDRTIKELAQKALFRTKQPIEITYRLHMNDGRIKWINEICSTDFDQNGNPIRFYGILQDITRFKVFEKKSLEKEEEHLLLINSLPVGIAIYQNEIITFVNLEAIHIFGAKDANELIGQQVFKFILPNSLNNFRKKMNGVSHRIASHTFHDQLIRLDGSFFEAEITPLLTFINDNPAVQLIINRSY